MLHDSVELIHAEPRELDVFRLFEAWRGKIAFHLDEIVQLASLDTIVPYPNHFTELGENSFHPPARLFEHLPAKRFEWRFAVLHVSARDVPAAREERTVVASSVNERSSLCVDDDRADRLSLTAHAVAQPAATQSIVFEARRSSAATESSRCSGFVSSSFV